jgi:hypothetical protein
MPYFDRSIGIDYSGAETPDSSRKGARVYVAEGSDTPRRDANRDELESDEQLEVEFRTSLCPWLKLGH